VILALAFLVVLRPLIARAARTARARRARRASPEPGSTSLDDSDTVNR
jgi:hypothetical protein